MTTACFNLVDEPWLPVTVANDFPRKTGRGLLPRVSLLEAFKHGDKIVDLRCYPHERIALMRLLICIAQRSLNGPADEADWSQCGMRLAKEASEYLVAHRDCFNLFGDGPRFLQAHGRGEAGKMPVFKLSLVDTDGTALFDAHVQPGNGMEAEELAVALVTYQSFAAGGKVGGSETSRKRIQTKSGKVRKEPQSGQAALCRDGPGALHAFVLGRNLGETIHWNILCKSQIAAPMTWDKSASPLWEFRQTKAADFYESRLKSDYLARLVPLARAVWLDADRKNVEVANGLQYGVFADSKDQKSRQLKPGTGIRELTAAVAPGRKPGDKDRLASASAGGGMPKAAWRELHAIAALRRSGMRGGPAALEHVRADVLQEAILWCGALVGSQAKVGDVIESVFRLPVKMLEDADAAVDDMRQCPGPNQTYRKGVGLADYWEGQLRKAVFTYHLRLGDSFSKTQNAARGRKVQNQAALRYWTTLEQLAERVLLHDIAVNSGRYWHSGDSNWMAQSPWGREVWRAAHDAYEFSCSHGTPRQLRAYAAGVAVLQREGRAKQASIATAQDNDSSNEGGAE